MIGETLGQYSIEALIGHGGMGSVYQGINRNIGSKVAIKVLHAHFTADENLVERFRREALVQAKLSHSNIVSALDFVQEGDTHAIIMEFVEGDTFDELLEKNGGPLPWRKVIDLFLPLLDALNFAHSQGVIHRDIKPANLILQEQHGKLIPKIMDFGIAKALSGFRGLTMTGAKMGTPHYMSPEQCKESKNITHQTDIYSIAVTMYQILTGRVPFDKGSDYNLMESIINDPPPSIRQLNSNVSEWLESTLNTAMAKEPDKRFASAGIFAQTLAHLIHDKHPSDSSQESSIKTIRKSEAEVEHMRQEAMTIPSPPEKKKYWGSTWRVVFIFAAILMVISSVTYGCYYIYQKYTGKNINNSTIENWNVDTQEPAIFKSGKLVHNDNISTETYVQYHKNVGTLYGERIIGILETKCNRANDCGDIYYEELVLLWEGVYEDDFWLCNRSKKYHKIVKWNINENKRIILYGYLKDGDKKLSLESIRIPESCAK